jgi:hypothetical protein
MDRVESLDRRSILRRNRVRRGTRSTDARCSATEKGSTT